MMPTHAHYEPRCSLYPYYVLHTSGNHLDLQEEAYTLEDILYLNNYENMTDWLCGSNYLREGVVLCTVSGTF
jgi:hypothetical protein